jgi:hypothetical protein
MIGAKLIELIEIHAGPLAKEATKDLMTNERTTGFAAVPQWELEQRVFQLYHHLGDWIGEPKHDRVQAEFVDWGRTRFRQGIRLSEIIYAIIVLKRHLRQYIADNGLVDASFPRSEGDYVLPLHMQSLQELNVQVGSFFDEALYHLTRGYEAEDKRLAAG